MKRAIGIRPRDHSTLRRCGTSTGNSPIPQAFPEFPAARTGSTSVPTWAASQEHARVWAFLPGARNERFLLTYSQVHLLRATARGSSHRA